VQRLAAERAEVAELDRLCVERYQRLAKWALQRQLKAIDHVSMRTVNVATMIQEGLEINRRMQEDRGRAIKFSQLRAVIKQLEERVSGIYDVAKEFFASEVTMRMELREDKEQMRRLADEAMCAIGHYFKSMPRVGCVTALCSCVSILSAWRSVHVRSQRPCRIWSLLTVFKALT